MKNRAYLKSLAMTMDSILQIGKYGIPPEASASVDETLTARELIKIHVLQNCLGDPKELGQREGYGPGSWVLLDFGDIIVHAFDKENRPFYNLEQIWSDRKVIDADAL